MTSLFRAGLPIPLMQSFTSHSRIILQPAHNESSLALKTLYIVLSQHDSSLCNGRANVKRCTYRRISRISRYFSHSNLTYTLYRLNANSTPTFTLRRIDLSYTSSIGDFASERENGLGKHQTTSNSALRSSRSLVAFQTELNSAYLL